jgi:hypothetical protein
VLVDNADARQLVARGRGAAAGVLGSLFHFELGHIPDLA